MEHKYFVAQVVGIIAIVFSLSVFQTNNRRKMLYAGAIGAIFWTLQFYLLGAEAGAAINAIGVIRNFTLARIKPRRENLWVLVVITILAAMATLLTWQGPAWSAGSCRLRTERSRVLDEQYYYHPEALSYRTTFMVCL